MAKSQSIYFFGNGKADGTAAMKNLLGGKGSNLAEMTRLGVPVPPGFTITSEVCIEYYLNKRELHPGVREGIQKNLAKVEKVMGKKFGDRKNPLLVSVRSGARVSMPGMMDTILNLGLNDETVLGLAEESNNARFAYDSYRRFMQMYGNVVFGMNHHDFEHEMQAVKRKFGVTEDTDLTTEALLDLIDRYKKVVKEKVGKPFPSSPEEQLLGAINSVFDSWYNKRAVEYRKINRIPAEWGTAANVQSMVFGNMGSDSSTGVAFTRDPTSGEERIIGEYLINAQGEDVVAGTRTPQQITNEHRAREGGTLPTLEETEPALYKQFVDICHRMEDHYRHPQDLEFTIEKGRLWLLQTRNAKRTSRAGLKWAMDMHRKPRVKSARLSREEVILRVTPQDIEGLFHPYIPEKVLAGAESSLLGKGLAGSPGAYAGRVVFDPDTAVTWASRGEKVLLLRRETSPEDIHGMAASLGFLTAVGGMTSHAVLVARQMNKACVAGVGEDKLRIDYAEKTCTVGGKVIKEGDWITLDGNSGKFYDARLDTVAPKPDEDFQTYMSWANKVRRLKVRTNADTPDQAAQAIEMGAEGIGLTRTEHMFFGDRVQYMRQMILNSNDREKRGAALEKLLPMQRQDFEGIFRAMGGRPVTIRLLDPPLHEFLPQAAELVEEIREARHQGLDEEVQELENTLLRVQALHELNPMLGHRGCRLAITMPEIYEMQVRAIMEAACQLKKEGVKVVPEIMIPLVGHKKELEITRASAWRIAESVQQATGVKVAYTIGTMIEIPRAALTADEIAEHADFFSFGTNDLTQMTFGFSRDDIAKFLPEYLGGLSEAEHGFSQEAVFADDPFVVIDQVGVGKLMKIAVQLGRSRKPGLKMGICGEHGGEPSSVKFCHSIGLDYVSCSPLRVPVAITAAAHAALEEDQSLAAQAISVVKKVKAAAKKAVKSVVKSGKAAKKSVQNAVKSAVASRSKPDKAAVKKVLKKAKSVAKKSVTKGKKVANAGAGKGAKKAARVVPAARKAVKKDGVKAKAKVTKSARKVAGKAPAKRFAGKVVRKAAAPKKPAGKVARKDSVPKKPSGKVAKKATAKKSLGKVARKAPAKKFGVKSAKGAPKKSAKKPARK